MYKLHRRHFVLFEMKRKLLSDISANSLQVIINQLFGLLIFYVLSTQLSKEFFGEINWSLAVLLTIFNILSFGIDQVIVKKIAAEENIAGMLAAYTMHVIIAGITVYALLLAGSFLFPGFFSIHSLLLLIGIGKLALFFSSPYKQLANGLEKFKALLFMSTCSNIIRGTGLMILALTKQLTVTTAVIIFIAGDIAEFILSLLITKYRLKIPLAGQWNTRNYTALIKESLPQMGVVLFTSALARFDWIFLGLFSTTIILANYSFAYKVFEVATVPLLVIAPILIPRFTKIFKQQGNIGFTQKKTELLALLRFEIIISCAVALVLNVIWIPAVDLITQHKYGAVNKWTILLLSASMPFLYFNNFLWTISFAKGDLKAVLRIFFTCFIINTAGIVLAIPLFNAEGAAAAYLFSIILQSVLFYYYHRTAYKFTYNIAGLCTVFFCAVIAGAVPILFLTNYWLILPSAVFLYVSLLAVTGQLTKKDRNLSMLITEL